MKSLAYSDRASLPRKPGIYYIYAGSNPFTRRLLYIGISKNLRERHTDNFGYGSHHLSAQFKALGASRIEYRTIDNPRQLKHEEAIAIAKYQPLLNKRKEKPDARLLWQERATTQFCRMIAAGILISVTWRYLLPMLIEWLYNNA